MRRAIVNIGLTASRMVRNCSGLFWCSPVSVVTSRTTLLLLLHPFNSLFSRTTLVSQYQKVKTSLDLNEARYEGVLGCSGISWTTCKQLAPRSRQITTPTPHHSILYKPDALPDDRPTVSKHQVTTKSTKYQSVTAKDSHFTGQLQNSFCSCKCIPPCCTVKILPRAWYFHRQIK